MTDGSDRCPDLPGPIENGGCPDVDGDGDLIADRHDRCPEQWGTMRRNGCPGPGGRAELAGTVFLYRGVAPGAATRTWLAKVATAMRAADARRATLTVVAEYGLSYGDSIDRARRRALALLPHVAAALGLPVGWVQVAWRGPDGRPRVEIDYR